MAAVPKESLHCTPEKRSAMSEKRREIRVESVNLINYSALEAGDYGGPAEANIYSTLGLARTKDLSANGCLLVTTQEIPEGLELSFDLQLGDHLVHCKGRVARVRETKPGEEWEAGVEFTDLDEMAEGGIKLYLEFKESNQ
jgi:hypothetical protein